MLLRLAIWFDDRRPFLEFDLFPGWHAEVLGIDLHIHFVAAAGVGCPASSFRVSLRLEPVLIRLAIWRPRSS